MQIIVDNGISDWRTGYVNHTRSREAQQQEQAKQAFLIMMHAGYFRHHLSIEADAWDNDNSSRRARIAEDIREGRSKTVLERARTGNIIALRAPNIRLNSKFFAQIRFPLSLSLL